MKAKKLTELSILTAVALILFIIELRIPNLSPIPNMKLGLSNIITVYAVYHYKISETSMIIFVRIILGCIFSGNISALPYSLSGAVMCLFGMVLLKKVFSEKQIWICSIFGALFHNAGQLIMAVIFTGTISVLAYFPVLVIVGTVSGAFTGICAMTILRRTKATPHN